MGIRHRYGYSAEVEAFFVVAGERIRVAKTNHEQISSNEWCNMPGTEGDMLVIIDGSARSRRVVLPEGAEAGQTTFKYMVAAPF